MPALPPTLEACTVYAPGGSVTRIAESLLDAVVYTNAYTAVIAAVSCGSPPQPAFDAIFVLPVKRASCGSGIVPDTNPARAGPEARTSTVFEVEPPITNPAVRVLVAPTWILHDRLISRG